MLSVSVILRKYSVAISFHRGLKSKPKKDFFPML